MAIVKLYNRNDYSFANVKWVYQDCFIELILDDNLNAEDTLDFTVPFKLIGNVQVDDLVDYKGKKFVVKNINTVRDTNGTYTQISCEGIYVLLLDKIITPSNPTADIPDTWQQGVSARTAIERVFHGTPFTVGTVDDFGTWDFDFYDMNALEALNSIRENMIGVNVVSSEYPGSGGTTPPDPGPDVNPASEVTNLSANPTGTAITLNWVNPIEADFDKVYIYRGGNFIASLTSPTSTYTEVNLSPDTLYTYLLKTTDKTGNFSTGITLNARTTKIVDKTPPGNVVGLAANTKTNTTITLTWAAVGASDFLKNKIYRNSILVGETTGTSYVDKGLSANTSYAYKVTSVDTSGNENAGATGNFTTLANAVTTPPANIATPTTTPTSTNIQITWVKPVDANFQKVNIYRNGVFVTNSTGTTYTDVGLTAGTTYSYRITSVDTAGNESGGTVKTVSTTAANDTAAPGNPTGVSFTSNTNSVTMYWTKPVDSDFSKVRIYRNNSLVTESTGTSYANTGLTANTQYTFKLTSVDVTGNESAGYSFTTTTASVNDTTPPANVSGLSATGFADYVHLAWTAPSDTDLAKFRIYRNNTYLGETTSLSWDDTSLPPSTSYTYKVTSLDTSGNESVGVTATGTTTADTTGPGLATNLSVSTTGGTQVTINWKNPTATDFATSRVYRDGVLVTTINGLPGATMSYTNTGLTPSTTYLFGIQSVDKTGNASGTINANSITTGSAPIIDTTPPAEVSVLTETHTSSTVTLQYNHPSNTDFAKSIIYRDNVKLVEKPGAPSSAITFTDTGLALRTSYTYKVTTVDSTGNESGGNIIMATTTGDTTPPANITGLTSSVTSTSVTFTFTKPNDTDFVKTKIYRTINSFPTYVGETTSGTFTETGLTQNVNYTYKLTTIDSTNNESSGVTVTVTTTQDLTPPAEITSLSYSHTPTSITLTWANPIDADFNYVDIWLNGGHEGSSSNGTYTTTSTLMNNTNYTFDLYSVDDNLNMSTGVRIIAKTGEAIDTTAPNWVSNLAVGNTTSNSIELTWTNPADSDFYKVYIYRDNLFVAEVIGTNSWIQNGLASQSTYHFEVRSVDKTGNATNSGPFVNGTTDVAPADGQVPSSDTTPPANVTDLGFQRTPNSITLMWVNPTDSDFARAQIFRNEVLVGETTSTVFTDNNLVSGNTYTYKVASMDTAGNRSMGTVITITLAPTSVTAYTFASLTDFNNFKMYYTNNSGGGLAEDGTKTLWTINADPVVTGVNAAYVQTNSGDAQFHKYLTWHESLPNGGTVQVEYRPIIQTIDKSFRLYDVAPASAAGQQLFSTTSSFTTYQLSTKYPVAAGERDFTIAMLNGNQAQSGQLYVKKIIVERY